MTQWNAPHDTGMMSPPTHGEMIVDEPQSKWPSVIGTISIIFASLGLLCYGCGALNAIASPWMAGMVPEDQRPPQPSGLQLAIQVSQMCLTFFLSIWLMFAGIALHKRRRAGRTHHVGWAFVKIILGIIAIIPFMMFMQDTIDQTNDQMAKNNVNFTLTREIMMIILVISTIWFMIYPVFLIIWFSRGKVKDEVATWP